MRFSWFSWTKLSAFGKNRFFKSAYFWLFFVPFCANLLSNVSDKFSISVFGTQFQIATLLPFSWEVFFFGSVIISAANLLYFIYCPPIIRNFSDMAHFEAQNNTNRNTYVYFIDFLIHWKKKQRSFIKDVSKDQILQFIKNNILYVDHLQDNIDHGTTKSIIGYKENRRPIHFAISPDNYLEFNNHKYYDHDYSVNRAFTFWELRKLLNSIYAFIRLITGILYVFGFCLICWIIFENIIFVITFVWQK